MALPKREHSRAVTDEGAAADRASAPALAVEVLVSAEHRGQAPPELRAE